ncbi:MAG: hypothetical protein ACR2G0_12750 [Chthoniobacterales bacterium]
MSFRKRFLVFLLVLLVLAGLDALLAPFVVARGVRFWITRAAHRQGLTAEIEEVEAPFWRAVTLRNLTIRSSKPGGHEVSIRAAVVTVDLNLHALIFRRPRSVLRSLRVNQLAGQIRVPVKSSAADDPDWRSLAQLVPDNFQLEDVDFDVMTATTAVTFRGVLLTASAIESGRFVARQVSVSAPLLRQTFTDLRGATSWDAARLTIAGIPLSRGLDLEALTVDLSRLGRGRVGTDLHLDTFGGTLRASFQRRTGNKFAVELAGSASNISLAQISEALGFLEPVTGSVRASKFTFRGHPGEFLDATASVWVEATDFAWRERRADNVMLGATYYGRRLEVDQLYVRQRENSLTVNGELVWPKKLRSWTQLPFRGQLNANIPDLNGFAQFWGAAAGEFSGALTAAGEVDLVNSAPSGRLSWQGKEVQFRGVPLDSLGGALSLEDREVTLEKLEARHAEDFLRAEGTFELTSEHRFKGRVTGAFNDLNIYAPFFPKAWRKGKIGGGATFDWRGDGTSRAHSGTLQLFAHGLQLSVAPLRQPLDVTLEGSYSPQDVFFRTFKLANDRFSLGGYLTLGHNFIELQTFELILDRTPRASGTVFLPLNIARWYETRSLLAALDEAQKFDVDLTASRLNLGELGKALGEDSLGLGVLTGRLAAFGVLSSLQITSTGHVEIPGRETEKSILDFSGRLASGLLEAEAKAGFGVSNPVTANASLPLNLGKKKWANGGLLDFSKPLSIRVDCPALFLETLPNEWYPGKAAGLLTGYITWSGLSAAPIVIGEADLLGARWKPPSPWPEFDSLSAHVRFQEKAALIDPVKAIVQGTPVELSGRLSAGLTRFGLTLIPAEESLEVVSAPTSGSSLSAVRLLGEEQNDGLPGLRKMFVRGTFWPMTASLTITTDDLENDSTTKQATYFLRPEFDDRRPLFLRLGSSKVPAGLQLGAAGRNPPSENE